MAAAGNFSRPPLGVFVAAYGEILMAADTPVAQQHLALKRDGTADVIAGVPVPFTPWS